jgi:group I intron endonuclease
VKIREIELSAAITYFEMGYIYKITAPNGKIYVGQTIYTVDARWRDHCYDAFDPKKNHCKLLNAHIRKYGALYFTIETIIECDNSELNQLEEYYIKTLNTLKPKGLNLKPGGSVSLHTEETKKKISETLKDCEVPVERRLKLSATKKKLSQCSHLPMYVVERRKDGVAYGYRVCNHPNGKDREFVHQKLTMDEKLKLALEYLEVMLVSDKLTHNQL